MTVMKRFSETNACGGCALINQRRQMRGLGSCSLSARTMWFNPMD
jgi:hypothetical protein